MPKNIENLNLDKWLNEWGSAVKTRIPLVR